MARRCCILSVPVTAGNQTADRDRTHVELLAAGEERVRSDGEFKRHHCGTVSYISQGMFGQMEAKLHIFPMCAQIQSDMEISEA